MQRYQRSIVTFLLLLLTAVPFTASAQSNEIYVLTIEGPVNQAMTSYFTRAITEAEEAGAHAVLIELDTPGGAVSETIEIVQLFRNAEVPIIVYVGPAGAQAASAGSVITLAAHASGMAPDTVIGAASPVSGNGLDIMNTLYRKIVEDLKAVMRNLAESRGPEVVAVAEAMVEEATALTGTEAFEIGLTDAIADNRAELLQKLDGIEVIVGDETRILQTATTALIFVPKTAVENFFYQLATILMTPFFISGLIVLGIQALIFEITNPGGWIGGFIGIISLGLALYGLGQLPVNYIGLALIGGAFVLFGLELFTPTYGALTITGAITLLAGLLITFNSTGTPEYARLPFFGALLITILGAGTFGFILTMALAIQRKQPASGQEGMIGMVGRVQREFTGSGGSYDGMVFVHGSRWQAEATEPLEKGAKVTVDVVDGLTLHVSRK